MQTLRFAEVSALHLEPEAFAHLRALAGTQPTRRSGFGYDAETREVCGYVTKESLMTSW